MAAGKISISEFDEARLGPNSYNLRLGEMYAVYDGQMLDMRQPNVTRFGLIPEEGMMLFPGKLYLMQTMEETWTDDYVPMLEGRSSVGRLGMGIHVTAGFGDLGFRGTWTLEVTTVHPLVVYPGEEICQIYFLEPVGYREQLYSGKYQGQTIPRESRMYMDERE